VDGRSLTGRIAGSDDGAVLLAVDGANASLAYADITKALIQVEFSRPETDQMSTAAQRGHETREG
jgi:ribosome maturation factor RimP